MNGCMTNEPERPAEPREKALPVCPVCGQECETVYLDLFHAVAGCDCCMDIRDAREWKEAAE